MSTQAVMCLHEGTVGYQCVICGVKFANLPTFDSHRATEQCPDSIGPDSRPVDSLDS